MTRYYFEVTDNNISLVMDCSLFLYDFLVKCYIILFLFLTIIVQYINIPLKCQLYSTQCNVCTMKSELFCSTHIWLRSCNNYTFKVKNKEELSLKFANAFSWCQQFRSRSISSLVIWIASSMPCTRLNLCMYVHT